MKLFTGNISFYGIDRTIRDVQVRWGHKTPGHLKVKVFNFSTTKKHPMTYLSTFGVAKFQVKKRHKNSFIIR